MRKILLAGTISNNAKKFERDLIMFNELLSNKFEVEYYFVESDSKDKTLAVLNKYKKLWNNFDFESKGVLATEIPERVERIRASRNGYVEYIKKNSTKKKWDFIFIADLDSMNSKLTLASIECVLNSEENWDAVFPVQRNGYYDLYALRHPIWNPIDFQSELIWRKTRLVESFAGSKSIFKKFLLEVNLDKLRSNVIYSKMLLFKSSNVAIEVESAFGGLGIYKTELFFKHNYSRILSDVLQSEHVDFHFKLRQDGYRLIVDPNLVNSNWNTYNINRFVIIRLLRRLKKYILNF